MKKLVVKISRKKFSNKCDFKLYLLFFQHLGGLHMRWVVISTHSLADDFHLFRSRISKMLKHFIHLWFCPKRIICFLSVNKTQYFRACFLQYIQFLRCWRHALGRIIPYLVCVRPHLTQSITLTKDLSLQYEKKRQNLQLHKKTPDWS